MSVFMNPLPPQAYTKDTLVQAYAWLQSQSDSVKEMATNPDILVSLFMKSKMQGDQFFERPSIQNFKNELKSLAGMIGEFEQTPPPTPHQTPAIKSQPSAPPPAPAEASIPFSSVTPPPVSNTKAQTHSLSQSAPQISLDEKWLDPIDARSLEMIREVKGRFNLSSDMEALRLLISIGHHKALQVLK
jgi:hypothetical protein